MNNRTSTMKRSLYIHIGTHKTGSTALQSFLTINQRKLQEYGVVFPGQSKDHYFVTKELREQERPYLDEKTHIFKIFSEIKNYLEKSNSCIISSEGFCESDKILLPRLIDTIRFFAIDVEIKIIVFLRPQVSWFESSYQQIVKDLVARSIRLFNEYVKMDYIYEYCDYNSHLNLWANYFGKDNIIVIPYDPMQHKAKLFTDLLRAIDVSDNLVLKNPPPQKTNIGLAVPTIEFLRWLNIIKIDNRLFQEIIAIFENNHIEQFKSSSFIDQEKSDEIEQFFEESNRLVAFNYLKRNDGILFPEHIHSKRNPGPIYLQHNTFMPELFIQQIEIIKNENERVLKNLYSHVYKLDLNDLSANNPKQQFLSILKRVLLG